MRFLEVAAFALAVILAASLVGLSGWKYAAAFGDWSPPQIEYQPSTLGPWGDFIWVVQIISTTLTFPFQVLPNLFAVVGVPEPWPHILSVGLGFLFLVGMALLLSGRAGW